MILLRPTLGLFSIIYIQLFLPLECTPALDSEEISMKFIEDDQTSFYFKSSRKLLGVRNNQLIHLSSEDYQNDKPWFWFCLIILIALFFLMLVRCCIKLAEEGNEEESRINVHSPPRTMQSNRNQSSTRIHARARPFVSPQTTSRSVILFPEPETNNHVFFAIDNPNFDIFTINVRARERSNPPQSNITPSNLLPSNSPPSNQSALLQDLPPAYDSVVTTNQQDNNNSVVFNNISNDLQNSESLPPPKYEDLHK